MSIFQFYFRPSVALGSNKIISKNLPSRRLSGSASATKKATGASRTNDQGASQMLDLTYQLMKCMPRGPVSEEAASALWAEMRRVLFFAIFLEESTKCLDLTVDLCPSSERRLSTKTSSPSGKLAITCLETRTTA